MTEGLILSTSLEVDTVRQFILLKEIIIITCGTLKFNVFLSEISKSCLGSKGLRCFIILLSGI